jgi:hypothetical protein
VCWRRHAGHIEEVHGCHQREVQHASGCMSEICARLIEIDENRWSGNAKTLTGAVLRQGFAQYLDNTHTSLDAVAVSPQGFRQIVACCTDHRPCCELRISAVSAVREKGVADATVDHNGQVGQGVWPTPP